MPNITIRGVSSLLKKLKHAEEQVWPTVMAVVDKYVDLMIENARSNAPVDKGVARDSLGKEVKQNSIIYFLSSAHGVMQEFGVGGLMGDIPPEIASDALQFKGYKSGDFGEFIKELEGWCSRKGIDPKFAYVIAVNILDNGLAPQPFFYPAFLKYKEPMMNEIREALDKLFNI